MALVVGSFCPKMNIFSKIRSEVDDFIRNSIEVVPNYTFNQYDTIKRINLYLASQFEDTSQYNGRDKIFYNITTPRRDTVARFLDIDTKDIRLKDKAPKSEIAAMILSSKLGKYIQENKINHLLNRIVEELPSYGSVVLEKKDKGAEMVDIRNLFLDPTVDSIEKSRFITTKHIMTVMELEEMKGKGWDADVIDGIIARTNAGHTKAADAPYEDTEGNANIIRSTPYVEVYRRFGLLEKGFVEDSKKEDMIMSVCVVANPFDFEDKEDGSTVENGGILYKSEWKKELPFRDCHFTKVKGRWLGVGVVEALFPAQERVNELVNQKRISMELSTMHLFQTADPTVLGNVFTDLENGSIVKTKLQGSLQPIANEERNLPAFNTEQQSFTLLADRVSFANDILSGGQIPSSTPATNVVVQNNNATSIHLFKREKLTIFLKDFFVDLVIPDLIKSIKDEEIIRVAGDSSDLQAIDDKIIEIRVENELKDMIIEGKEILPDTKQQITDKISTDLKKTGSKRFVKVFKDYLKKKIEDVELDIFIDNEQEDVATVANNTFSFLTTIAQNPQLLDDPVQKELVYSYAKKIGVNVGKLEIADAKRKALQVQEAVVSPIQPGDEDQKSARLPKTEALPLEEEQLAEVA